MYAFCVMRVFFINISIILTHCYNNFSLLIYNFLIGKNLYQIMFRDADILNDAKLLGALDAFTVFSFVNKLRLLNRQLKKFYRPLQ